MRNPTTMLFSQADSLTIAPHPSHSLLKSGPPKITPDIPEKSPGSSAPSQYRPGAAVNGKDPSNTRHGTLVYVDLPPLQGPPVETIEGLEDALSIFQREATAARRIVRSHQSRLTSLEGDILVIRNEIAAMKENSRKGNGCAE